MPNENTAVCGCGIALDVSRRKTTVPLWRNVKSDGRSSKKQHNDGRGSKNRSSESGGSSSVADHARPMTKNSKQEKRLNHSRRTRSAERVESHYTYIDSNSSILTIREAIPEAVYATIPDTPNMAINETGSGHANSQNRSQPIYAIPSMTSPPPTYDVAIAKSWQTGLPPTYEEYLCHQYEMVSRSHTPPPPWTDSTTNTTTTPPSSSAVRTRLAQITISNNEHLPLHQHQQMHQQQQHNVHRDACLTNQQLHREHQVRAQQRSRPMPPRSQSESRAQQQRLATMYEDGAFCMETTALQSMFEHGVAFCSLM